MIHKSLDVYSTNQHYVAFCEFNVAMAEEEEKTVLCGTSEDWSGFCLNNSMVSGLTLHGVVVDGELWKNIKFDVRINAGYVFMCFSVITIFNSPMAWATQQRVRPRTPPVTFANTQPKKVDITVRVSNEFQNGCQHTMQGKHYVTDDKGTHPLSFKLTNNNKASFVVGKIGIHLHRVAEPK
jgi:hypothetical protein